MTRGKIDPTLGITEGKLRTLLKGGLRIAWRNSSRKQFLASVRTRGINPATGRERFVVTCEACGREMGMSEKERRTKKDGSLEKRAKSAYEVDHIHGITSLGDIKDTLGQYAHDLLYGEMRIMCWSCHKSHTFKK